MQPVIITEKNSVCPSAIAELVNSRPLLYFNADKQTRQVQLFSVHNCIVYIKRNSFNTLLPTQTVYSRRRGYSVQSRPSVCLSVSLSACFSGKRLELSTPNFIHIYSIAVARHALTRWSKGHTVTKTVTVARLLVIHASTAVCAAAAGVGLHGDTTAYVF